MLTQTVAAIALSLLVTTCAVISLRQLIFFVSTFFDTVLLPSVDGKLKKTNYWVTVYNRFSDCLLI